MAGSDEPVGPSKIPKMSFGRKSLSRRMRRVESVTVRHARRFVFKRWNNAREVQSHIIIWIIAVGLLIGATGLQLMWFQKAYVTQAPATDGTYAEAVLGPVNTLDPLFASSSAEQSAGYLLFSSLLNYDTTGHLSNDLATNISINDAKTTYTVSIRPDATWSDGYKVTAQDVAFTVGLLKNPAVRSTITGWSSISVSVINDTTVSFTLPAVYAAFEDALTFPILPEHILKNVAPSELREDNFSQSPVGSGPFKFTFLQSIDSRTGREVIHMERNANYYKGTPNLDRFQLHVYGTQSEIVQALASGEVNAAEDVAPSDLSQINTKNYTIDTKPISTGIYALINTTSPLLKDLAIRQALQIGTNTTAIRKKLIAGTPDLYLPFINGQITGNVSAEPVYNLAAAKALLQNDGWVLNGNIRHKDGAALRLSVITVKGDQFESALQTLAGQWRDLGIDVQTQVVDPNDVSQNVVQSILQPRNYDVLLYPLTIGADPDVYAYWHSSQATPDGFNFSNYSNVISDDALASARSRLEPDLRNAKYVTFARQWLADVPAIGLYQSVSPYIYSKTAQSINTNSVLISPTDRYANILNWSVGTKSVYTTP